MDRYISPREVVLITSCSLQHINRLESKGDFPRRRRLGPSRVGWLQSEVNEWMKNRVRVIFRD